jgi:hemoglobin
MTALTTSTASTASGTADGVESPFVRLGGEEGVRELVERFYEFMDTLPEARTIREMHARDLGPMVDKLTVFMTGWMGGPQRYRERFGPVIIPLAHAPYPIGSAESTQWLLCMRRALESVAAEPDLIEMLMTSLSQMARMCETQD